MKKYVHFNTNQVKSLDMKRVLSIKKRFEDKEELNESFDCEIPSLYRNIIKIKRKSQKEIEILSNANLNILKNISTFVKEELNNSTGFPTRNNNKISKLNNSVSPVKILNKNIQNIYSPNKLSQNSLYIKKNIRSELSPSNKNLKINKKSSLNKKNKNIRKSFYKSEINNKYLLKKRYKRNSVFFSNKLMPKAFIDEIKSDKLLTLKNTPNKKCDINDDMKTKINFCEFMNEMEIMKINDNLRKDINFLKLKRRISKMKYSFKNKINLKNKNDNDIVIQNNNIESKEINSINNTLNTNSKLSPKNDNTNNNDDNIYRILRRKNELYDSFDDEEYNEEILGFYISPDSLYIKIFNSLLLIISISYSIFVPFLLSKNYFSKNDKIILNIIFIFIDIIYMIDCIINLFIGYKNFDEHLILRTKKIMRHYLKRWFIIDFLQAIPFFTLIIYNIFSINFNYNNKIQVLLLLKIIKLFKMLYFNNTISDFGEILSSIEIIDNYSSFILSAFIMFIILNMTTCLFIFLGNNSYPNWIIKINMQNENYSVQYLTSIYFIIVTITTVGYGDITGLSSSEIGFQIYLLIIGTIAYSFTISYISNQIVKINQRSMNFEKNMDIINEIKLHNPCMNDCLYNEVVRNINNMKLYEKKDKHILLDSLPYFLKNKLIICMYQDTINNFIFFKNIDNSDFIAKVVTSFVPIISIKDDIVIQEGNYITEIIYVKRGVITLNINFDLNDITNSLNKFYYKNQLGKFNIKYFKHTNNQCLKQNIHTINQSEDTNSNSKISTNLFSPGKICKLNHRYIDMKIVEIRKNEHFGDALMFLNERSPLNAKIRSKTAELLMLRKLEAIKIYSLYPNIWKRINKISLHNMDQIYLKIKKSVIKFSKIYDINLDSILHKNKNNKINKKITENDEIKEEKNSLKKNKIDFNLNKISEEKKENISDMNKIEIKKEINDINNDINKNNMNEININENNINEKNNKKTNLSLSLSKIKAYFQNSLKVNKDNNIKTEKENIEINSSLVPCISNILDETINYNSNQSGILLNKINSKQEKKSNNSFTDLTLIKEENFQINSSYENINKLSNYNYIKNSNLQLKIKKILIEEISQINNNLGKSFLNIPNTIININKNSSYNTLIFNENIKSGGDLTHKNSCRLSPLYDDNNNINFSRKTFGLNNNNITNSINSQNQTINSKSRKMNSSTKIIPISQRSDSLNNPINSQKKLVRKKTCKIQKQLNIISKNIENSSKNINNPEEFYSELFKDIIDKNSHTTHSNQTNLVSNIRKDTKNNTNINLYRYYMKEYDGINREGNLGVINNRNKEKDISE